NNITIMWLTCLVSLSLLTTVTLAATATSADKVLSNHASILADNSANLAISLYQNMAKEKGADNILISPVVVASSLGLVALGGKGSTALQVKTILNAAKVQDEQLHSGLAELLTEVSDPKARNVTWNISSRLYGPSSVTFLEDFVKSSKKHYKCDHSKINFRDKKSAVNSINEWAAKSTNGKLPEVTKHVENTDGAMIVNAMFFKRKGLFDFYDDTTHKLYLLSMPLAHKKSTVLFIMPYHVESLDRLEKLLSKKQLDTWMGKMKETAVAVSLPKVSMEVSHNLQVLGLTEAVDKSKADLSNISGKKDLYLSSVLHAAALEWDSHGNEIDTTIFGTEKLKTPKLFYADHPFIFLVKDKKTNSVLFIGRMIRPKGEKMRDEL
ncbi:Serpin H1, partial [Goodea atripinnis]